MLWYPLKFTFIGFFPGFATNKTELNAVFDIFDKDNKYYMEYSEFIEALKPDRHVSTKNYWVLTESVTTKILIFALNAVPSL